MGKLPPMVTFIKFRASKLLELISELDNDCAWKLETKKGNNPNNIIKNNLFRIFFVSILLLVVVFVTSINNFFPPIFIL